METLWYKNNKNAISDTHVHLYKSLPVNVFVFQIHLDKLHVFKEWSTVRKHINAILYMF